MRGILCVIAPYVKVYLMDGKTCVEKQKTMSARRTLDPLYQQQLCFTMPYNGRILQVEIPAVLVYFGSALALQPSSISVRGNFSSRGGGGRLNHLRPKNISTAPEKKFMSIDRVVCCCRVQDPYCKPIRVITVSTYILAFNVCELKLGPFLVNKTSGYT